MATLTIPGTHNFTGETLTNIDSIVFSTSADSIATFTSNQFGAGLISDSVQFTADTFVNAVTVNLSAAGTFSAAGWTFVNWTSNDPIAFVGTAGADTITGSSQADQINGGDGADTLTGRQGNDSLNGGIGNDTFIWNPGDGSDLIEGGTDTDTLRFNGSAGAEIVAISASGERALLTRNVGNIVMDVNDVERVDLHTLGGADTVTINDLTATDVRQVDVDLGVNSAGDAAVDSVVVNGTTAAGGDVIQVTGTNGLVQVTGLAATVNITFSEVANDRLTVNGLGGNDTISGGVGLGALIQLTIDGGDGNDAINGGNGADTLIGGNGDDTIDGNQGNDTAFLGSGNDTFVWDPGDGSDIVEGQADTDTLLFNGSVGAEIFAISANVGRALFTRNVGNIVMDLDDVEHLELNAKGGTDTFTINNLTGTDLTQIVYTGGSGVDTINGASAVTNLTITGGIGNDNLATGSGSDRFIWNIGDGTDAINGGGGADTLQINGTSASATFTLNPAGANALFSDGITTLTPAAVEQLDLRAGDSTNQFAVGNLDGTPMTGLITYTGGAGIDAVNASAAVNNMNVSGGAANDTLTTGAGVDTLNGGAGNDVIDGGANIDTASYSGPRAQFRVDQLGSGGDLLVFDLRPGAPDGIDAVRNVENFTFSDGTFAANDVINRAPLITSNGGGTVAAFSVVENETAVTIVTATDPNPGPAPTYSIVGGADAARFQINGASGALAFVAAPNFEVPGDSDANNSYVVQVRASDGALFDDQVITVTVTDVNEAPLITSNGVGETAAVSIAENTTAVTTVTATDPDLGQTLSYSIIGGADASKFTIGASTGALSFVTAPNFELPTDAGGNNIYDMIVKASDGQGGIDTQAIAVTVTNVTEPPVHWIGSVDVGSHPPGYTVAGTGDFNGDGTNDVLWFNAGNGDTEVWKTANGQWAGSVDIGHHPLGYAVSGVGDFNNDGTDDVLWYNQTTTDTEIWKISNGNWAGSVDIGSHPAGWKPAGIGDFDHNGSSDVLWFNQSNGNAEIWKVVNGQWAGSVDIGNHPAGYTVAGVGDFNADGTDDVLWFNAATGDAEIWKISNAQWAGSVDIGLHPPGWKAAGVGDFNADGTDDVLWFEAATGATDIWKIIDGHWAGSDTVGTHPLGYTPVGVGDLDHNTIPDITWQENGTGHIEQWLLA